MKYYLILLILCLGMLGCKEKECGPDGCPLPDAPVSDSEN
jgi:hypothetical protein